jgi:hypothetical protein
VAEGKPIGPEGGTLYDGYVAEAVLAAIKQSSAEGRRVDIKL